MLSFGCLVAYHQVVGGLFVSSTTNAGVSNGVVHLGHYLQCHQQLRLVDKECFAIRRMF